MATTDTKTTRTLADVQAALEQTNQTIAQTVRSHYQDAVKTVAAFIAKLSEGNVSHALQWDLKQFYQAQVVVDQFKDVQADLHLTVGKQVPAGVYLANLVERVLADLKRGTYEHNSTNPVCNLMEVWKSREQADWLRWAEPLAKKYQRLLDEEKTITSK